MPPLGASCRAGPTVLGQLDGFVSVPRLAPGEPDESERIVTLYVGPVPLPSTVRMSTRVSL